MHIEFNLPYGAGMAAGYRNYKLKERVTAWATTHNIKVINWTDGYRCCFEFAKPSDYTLFRLCWTSSTSWDDYTVITDD